MKVKTGWLTILFFLASCKKEITISYPSVYHGIEYQVTTLPRIFTSNGEITNQANADKFRTYNSTAFTPAVLESYPHRADTINVESAASLKIYEDFSYSDYIVSRNKNELVCKAAVSHPVDWDPLPYGSPTYEALLYKPVLENERIVNGFHRFDVTEFRVVDVTSADEVYMPVLVFALMSPTRAYVSGDYFNTFNNNFNYKILGPQDTFAVQEYKLLFRK